MAYYKAQWAYRSALWPEPITEGKILDLTDEQVAALNADSPGVVKPIDLVEKAEPKPEPEPEPEPEERAMDEAPKTMAKRTPARKRRRSIDED